MGLYGILVVTDAVGKIAYPPLEQLPRSLMAATSDAAE